LHCTRVGVGIIISIDTMMTTTLPAPPEVLRGANQPWQRKSMTMKMIMMACTLVGLNFLAAWLNIDKYRRRLLGGTTTSRELTTTRTTAVLVQPVANVSMMIVVPMEKEAAEEDEAVIDVVDDDDDSLAWNRSILAADAPFMMIHDVTLAWRTHDVRRNNMWLRLLLNNKNNCSDYNDDDRGRNGGSGDASSSSASGTTKKNQRNSSHQRPRPQPLQKQPPAMLLLTNYGWNQRNQTAALQLYRGVRPKELIEGVIHHPWFYPNSTDWIETIYRHHYYPTTTAFAVAKNATHNATVMATTADDDEDRTTRYYVFLDYETCFERNYPVYGSNLERNADTGFNRTDNLVGMKTAAAATNNPLLSLPTSSLAAVRQRYQQTIQQLLRQGQEAATESHHHHPHGASSPPPPPHVTLISFHCGGNALNTTRFSSGKNDVYAVISGRFDQLRPNVDLGLVPPALHQKVLAVPQRTAEPHQPNASSSSSWCDESRRPYFIQFSGNFRADTRQQLRRLHNGQDIYIDTAPPPNEPSMGAALLKSVFALTPRGDNLFSYRFTEVLSTGAIPVVHADDWMLPFDAPLVDWRDIVVRIPESRANETVDILRAIPPARRCEMRRRGFAFWQAYMKDGDAVIRGIVDTLEGRRRRRAGLLQQAPAAKKRQAPAKRQSETTSPVAPVRTRQAPVKRRSETSPTVAPATKRQAPARRRSDITPPKDPSKKRQAPAKRWWETTPPAVAAG
jgi:hypothetical protein